MKAIQVQESGGPEVLQLKEMPEPKPGARQIVVQMKAIGVNPVDTYIRAGGHGFNAKFPYTPGMDGAGTVKEVGPGVDHLHMGQKVYVGGSISGTYAEQALCHEQQVFPMPDRLTFPQGAAIHVPYASAYRALFIRANALPGETVLIHGASGGVGIAAVQLARANGLRVIGTAGTDKGLELVRKEGAHLALNHRAPDYFDKIREFSKGGVDLILEMLANVNLGKDLSLLKRDGRVVVIGSRGTVEIDPRVLMSLDGTILGMTLMNASAEELESIHAALYAGFENGTLRPVVSQEFVLRDAAKAHKAVMEPGAYGKIVLIP